MLPGPPRTVVAGFTSCREALQRSKFADEEFTVLPIDDHGDIDPRADFTDCVAASEAQYFPVADQMIPCHTGQTESKPSPVGYGLNKGKHCLLDGPT